MESFSSKVKREVSVINIWKNHDEIESELFGYLLTCSENKFVTESEYNINRFAKILKNLKYDNFKISVSGKNYIIEIRNFNKFKKIYNYNDIDVEFFYNKENIIRAFVRGVFLGRGSINNPKSGYHMEMLLEDVDFAKLIKDELFKYNIDLKILVDKNIVLYLKDGENISNFLAFIGAGKAVLEFEEERVVKEVRNNINRLVNCETANLQRIVKSSVSQVDNIKLIKNKKKFSCLSEGEQEIAELRLKFPNVSLKDLGNMVDPKISKTTVSYRFNNIKKLADELR